MSHVATVDIKIKDLTALRQACEAAGGKFHEGKKTYNWYGRWVGDTAFTREMFETVEEYERVLNMTAGQQREHMTGLLGRCHHAMSFPGANYEVGVVVQSNGEFRLMFDYYYDGGLSRVLGGDKLPKLMQHYAVQKTHIEAEAQGFIVEDERTLQDGSVEMYLLPARR